MLCTDNWSQIDFPSGDVTVIQLTGIWGKLTIFNIYNNCEHNDTIKKLAKFQWEHVEVLERVQQGMVHTLWLGDFNRHHPYWDKSKDSWLFTREATKVAEILIEATIEVGLEMILPNSIPTHIHNVSKKWTRLDNIFISEHSLNLVTICDTVTSKRGINTDHLPILSKLNLETAIAKESAIHNFREVNWEEFNNKLKQWLTEIGPTVTIQTQYQLNETCEMLTKIIQETISKAVSISHINAKTKRWWTKELTILQ